MDDKRLSFSHLYPPLYTLASIPKTQYYFAEKKVLQPDF